jgi:hypothetical protein
VHAAVAFTPWAVEFRYGDSFEASALDRTEAEATVAAVMAWAADAINE